VNSEQCRSEEGVLFDGVTGGSDHLAGDGVEGIGRRTE
jgi:hypothetical protein